MKSLYFCALATAILAAGCNGRSTSSGESDSTAVTGSAPSATVESPAHATEGPHHGTLIELGNEEYHAELVHDDNSVTIYILDAAAKTATPIDATDVSINLVHDGKPQQFKLVASPDANDPSGKASRFTLPDAELVEELEHGHAATRLSVVIDGKSYRGEIHHDHAAHEHAH